MQEYNTHDPKFNPYALGVLVRVSQASISVSQGPGDLLRAKVVLREDSIRCLIFPLLKAGEQVIMKNQFRLANIPTERLYGEST